MFERRSSGFASHNPRNIQDQYRALNLPCLHEYRNVFDEIFIPVTQMLPRNPLYSLKSNVALFKRNIYRAQYAFATLKKIMFRCCSRMPPAEAVFCARSRVSAAAAL